MRKIIIEKLKGRPVSENRVEIVERKGIGHPDYICDSIMEEISVALSKIYKEKFGAVLHHNIDKGMLAAGAVERRFGGGSLIEPMRMIFGDRAAYKVDGETIPVSDIAINTAKEWFKKNLRFVDSDKHINYQVEIKEGSAELSDIFKRGESVLGANDTSAAVGYAPFTETERIVLDTERFLNSKEFKERFPETGEDVKIMGIRERQRLHLTIAMPLIDKYIDRETAYFKKKKEIKDAIEEFARNKISGIKKVNIYLNTLDKKGRGIGGMYLSVLGTSAEDADSGQVGRGNRVNGVISLNRPMGTEAAAGKNPVSHVGKIYNILTHKIANDIYQKTKGIKEVYVWMCSQIGAPIDQPKIISAQLILEKGASFSDISKMVEEIINFELDKISEFCNDLTLGKYSVC